MLAGKPQPDDKTMRMGNECAFREVTLKKEKRLSGIPAAFKGSLLTATAHDLTIR